MGIVVVDVCQANKLTTIDIETLLEQEFPEVAVIMNNCLSFCGLCANSYFAQVNGKIVHGKTIDECVDNIREAIRKELAIYFS
ncbi:MAG TPA: DUF1450 domain-containing protein [Pseudogracilibacillus sp.]|nr:DUF1450 domain-containing protein [Pseudogracilibacillus sp.]